MRISLRSERGSQTVEFGAALALFVSMILVPIINYSVIPLRWILANQLVSTNARKMSFCETFSQSQRMLRSEPSLGKHLEDIGGIEVKSVDLGLLATRINGRGSDRDSLFIANPGQVPPHWLPDSTNGGPCTYSLVLKVSMNISPAIPVSSSGPKIMGLTAPFPATITVMREWENLGRDPVSGKFYLNE